MNLYELMEGAEQLKSSRPQLLPIQLSLLERGKAAYGNGVRRAIWQAPCGSGKTIVASEQVCRAVAMEKKCLWMVHRRRLVDQAIWTMRKFGLNPAPIMEGRQSWTSNVYCASRDTLLSMLKNGCSLPVVDLLINDEAHVEAKEVLSWYLEKWPRIFWTGYTASPIRPDGNSMNPPYQALVCMGSTSDLINLKRLCSVKVFNPDAVGKRRRKGEKTKPVGDPVAHWKKYALDLPTVAYAANVADSKELADKFIKAGITAEHMDASTPEDEREAIFERSRLGITKIICNCGVLIEGVDLPWLVCCILMRGCNSLVLWIQATGRVMRAFPGKDFGIVLDHAGAAHEYLLENGWDYQWVLDDAAANVRLNKPPKDRKPVVCQGCGFVFSGKASCPECGRVLPAKKRKSLLESVQQGDGILTEFTGQQNGHIAKDTLVRLFKKCYFIAKNMGRTMGAAAMMFKKQAKMLPWQADLELNLPGPKQWNTPAKEWHL